MNFRTLAVSIIAIALFLTGLLWLLMPAYMLTMTGHDYFDSRTIGFARLTGPLYLAGAFLFWRLRRRMRR